jgi:threonine/homoserine/homoserine lactone efflux protein
MSLSSAALLPQGPALAAFMLAVLALNATPGVDMTLTLTRSLQRGVWAGLAVALGTNLGCVVHAFAAAFGLAALLALSPMLFTALKWLGAAWLFWLGASLIQQAWRAQAARPSTAAPALQSFAAGVREGFVTNLLNPKVALFFLAFLPQFIAPSAPDKAARMLALGGLFVLQSLLFLCALVAVCGVLRRLRFAPWFGRALQALGGATLIGMSLRLATARN